jgi:protease II
MPGFAIVESLRCRSWSRPAHAPLQDTLFREMLGHIKETDLSVPELIDG